MPDTPYTLTEIAEALDIPLGPLLRILELHRANCTLKAQHAPPEESTDDR